MEYPVLSTQTNPPTNNITTNIAPATATATATAPAAVIPISRQPSPNPGHPPYAEMIMTAVKALNDRTGSSKASIDKFIKRHYANLPPKHQASLNKHLGKLKLSGQLVAVKNSFKLAEGSSALPSSSSIDNNFGDVSQAAGDVITSVKRMGRPPKRSIFSNRDEEVPAQIVVPFAETEKDPAGPGTGPVLNGGVQAMPKSKTKRCPIPDEGQSNGSTHSLFVSLGLEDGPDGLRKSMGNGRPATTSLVAETQVGLSGLRRRGGRPRKFGSAAPGVNVVPAAPKVVPNPVEVPVLVPFMQPQSQQQPAPSAAAGVDGMPPPAKKRRGRQPKAAQGVEINVGTQSSGMAMGRPEQSAAADGDSEIAKAYAVLERKFKFLQDSVKETVSAVKPSVNNATAVGQLNKLDELASVLTL